MNTQEVKTGTKKIYFGAAVFLSAFLSACGQQTQLRESAPSATTSVTGNNSVGNGPRTVAELESRYETLVTADEALVDCMESYIPDYRSQMETYGEVFMGDPLDNTPHPSEEGCRIARDTRNQIATELGLPRV